MSDPGAAKPVPNTPVFLPRQSLQRLLDALVSSGWQLIGPLVRDGAVVFDPIDSVEELPRGIRDIQSPGRYRLEQTDSARLFGWANGPQALKPITFAPEEVLWQVVLDGDGLHFESQPAVVPPTAVIGVRGCDLAALKLQQAHFLQDGMADPAFRRRLDSLFIVAVDCAHPAETCFCASTGDGPEAGEGYDIALTELDAGFLLRTGTPEGRGIVDSLALETATAEQLQESDEASRRAVAAQSRKLPGTDLRDALFASQEHPHWAAVAERCLACGNCTAVCPSCFCSAYQPRPSLDGAESEQVRMWDSCFSFEHSNLHGHPVRDDIRLRYRQWLTHKLAGWHDQYGRSGCTGCGRCISWCPVGIDLTEEVAMLLEDSG